MGDIMSVGGYEPIPSFKFWCQHVLPQVYDDSLSYYEVLCKMAKYLNTVINNQEYFNSILQEFKVSYEDALVDIERLSEELEKVKNGEYVSLYLDSIVSWIDRNIQTLVARIVKYVCFGLTSNGYFAAYIPQTWDFITFDTILDANSDLYGHLVLRW